MFSKMTGSSELVFRVSVVCACDQANNGSRHVGLAEHNFFIVFIYRIQTQAVFA